MRANLFRRTIPSPVCSVGHPPSAMLILVCEWVRGGTSYAQNDLRVRSVYDLFDLPPPQTLILPELYLSRYSLFPIATFSSRSSSTGLISLLKSWLHLRNFDKTLITQVWGDSRGFNAIAMSIAKRRISISRLDRLSSEMHSALESRIIKEKSDRSILGCVVLARILVDVV